MNPLKVYLCDLTHETVILVSDTIPLNIGYIGSYAKKIHGEKIDISLFKYPEKAIDAIKKNPPDVLALSNYSWNSNLSEYVASIARKFNSNVLFGLGLSLIGAYVIFGNQFDLSEEYIMGNFLAIICSLFSFFFK